MAITDELLQLLNKNNQNQQDQQQQQQQPNSWVQNLIDQRYQPKTERLKRTPVGFNFQREPFDPSSYYRALGTFKDISRLATDVVNTQVANKRAAESQAAYEAGQNALNGVNPNFTGGAGYTLGNAAAGVTKHYKLRGISPIAAKAADYFGSKYGIRTIYGLGPGSVPGSDHPKGRALDYMINNLKNGRKVGNSLANDVIQNWKAYNVKYVIWYHYIWYPGRGWSRYHGPSPHTDHVHVSFNK